VRGQSYSVISLQGKRGEVAWLLERAARANLIFSMGLRNVEKEGKAILSLSRSSGKDSGDGHTRWRSKKVMDDLDKLSGET